MKELVRTNDLVRMSFLRALLTDARIEHVVLDTHLSDQIAAPENDALRVHEALEVLEKAEPRLAQVAEMRFFGGLSEPEIAEALGLSERTVRRDWEKARLLLLAAMG
jgi:RNA polymerase sigma factor (sigma-70 family)